MKIDPWEILGKNTWITWLGGEGYGLYWNGVYGTFRLIVLSICILSIMGSVLMMIVANTLGSSQDIQNYKNNISSKLAIIGYVCALIFIFSTVKIALDDLFGFKQYVGPSKANYEISDPYDKNTTNIDINAGIEKAGEKIKQMQEKAGNPNEQDDSDNAEQQQLPQLLP